MASRHPSSRRNPSKFKPNPAETQELYRLLSEGAGDGIFTVDLKGRIVYANPTLERLVRIPLKISRGTLFARYVSRGSLARTLSCFHRALKGMTQISEEVEILDNQGQVIPVEINVSPLYVNGKIVYIHAIIRDIRNRKQLEHIVKESEKIKAMQYFISGTTQELQHPLLAVLRLTEDLRKRYEHRDFEYIGYNEYTDIFRALKAIGQQVGSCYETLERLIDLNKKKAGFAKNQCDVNNVIQDVVRLKDEQLKAGGIRIRLYLEKNLPLAGIGKIEFTQVINNIVMNALQAMPAGGRLSVKTAYKKENRRIQMDVEDEGVGIAKEHLPHIFEPFFTTKQRGAEKNIGLGLPIVYALVKACQGDIEVTSSLRKGTVVRVWLGVRKKGGA